MATFFVILAVLGALISTGVNLRAWFIVESGPWHRYFGLVAALSVFYVAAWGALLCTDVPRGQWSEVVTPISTLTFFTVWVGPAILLVMSNRHAQEGT